MTLTSIKRPSVSLGPVVEALKLFHVTILRSFCHDFPIAKHDMAISNHLSRRSLPFLVEYEAGMRKDEAECCGNDHAVW